MKKNIKAILLAMPAVLLVAGVCRVYFGLNIPYVTKMVEVESPSLKEPDNTAVEESKRVTLVAVGDVMMHIGQIWSGYDEEKKVFDYSGFFEKVRDVIDGADIAMANLETTMAGPEEVFTGYPRFNSPDEIADALKYAGFDIIFTSNNHSMDRGEKGVIRTIKVLKDRGLVPVGTNETKEDRNNLTIKEVNGIRLAFLAYTYGTNGIPLPKEKAFLVNLIDEDVILKDIKAARESADAIVLYLHFGQEYSKEPTKNQRILAQKLILAGADLIVASHPHVVQPGEWIEIENPSGKLTKKYIAFSLGNFISAQNFPHTDEGVILKVTLEKGNNGDSISIVDLEEIPTWVSKYKEKGRMKYVVELGKKP
ncbi:poly-gamma-glutamate synthesis protein (capsule biosynthesis protein) [Caldanaerovirga acetigignens]|uniref:Poly-gamma-glutamate synthesis protein (Capsule biosynthesis protein) n=1 Tax=Caldanaerovirga acetigignens TaxID=447595 RepID=A0A1M7HF31_9FIRM|nr:CapA family protein [Caldanaerovirga acetigignens]SHM27054.1 poly-gamma-glutamate synthesis protein (capsule biosynthesis protein) [Caldanaerovirga acetigignens]